MLYIQPVGSCPVYCILYVDAYTRKIMDILTPRLARHRGILRVHLVPRPASENGTCTDLKACYPRQLYVRWNMLIYDCCEFLPTTFLKYYSSTLLLVRTCSLKDDFAEIEKLLRTTRRQRRVFSDESIEQFSDKSIEPLGMLSLELEINE